MTFRQIEVFCAVARHGSMKLAAAELGLTCGTVSQMVELLQTRMGQDLVADANRNGTKLTAKGERFALLASPGIREIRRAIEDARGQHG